MLRGFRRVRLPRLRLDSRGGHGRETPKRLALGILPYSLLKWYLFAYYACIVGRRHHLRVYGADLFACTYRARGGGTCLVLVFGSCLARAPESSAAGSSQWPMIGAGRLLVRPRRLALPRAATLATLSPEEQSEPPLAAPCYHLSYSGVGLLEANGAARRRRGGGGASPLYSRAAYPTPTEPLAYSGPRPLDPPVRVAWSLPRAVAWLLRAALQPRTAALEALTAVPPEEATVEAWKGTVGPKAREPTAVARPKAAPTKAAPTARRHRTSMAAAEWTLAAVAAAVAAASAALASAAAAAPSASAAAPAWGAWRAPCPVARHLAQ